MRKKKERKYCFVFTFCQLVARLCCLGLCCYACITTDEYLILLLLFVLQLKIKRNYFRMQTQIQISFPINTEMIFNKKKKNEKKVKKLTNGPSPVIVFSLISLHSCIHDMNQIHVFLLYSLVHHASMCFIVKPQLVNIVKPELIKFVLVDAQFQ